MNRPNSIREEPSIQELIDARERTDGGVRVAMPMLFDGLGPDPVPSAPAAEDTELREDYVAGIRAHVAEARREIIRAMTLADAIGEGDLHRHLAGRAEDLGNSDTVIEERWSA